VRIVNTSDMPFEYSFNSVVYGPYAPGVIVDLPYEVAEHGIKRSVVLDDVGNPTEYRMKTIEEAKADPEKFQNMLQYACPFTFSDQCTAKPFKSVDDLRKHLEVHWAAKSDVVEENLFDTVPAKPAKK
jgi:hypothetical protein